MRGESVNEFEQRERERERRGQLYNQILQRRFTYNIVHFPDFLHRQRSSVGTSSKTNSM